jgi:hypothetical protein
MNKKYIWLFITLLGFTACNDVEDVLKDNNIDTSTEIVPEDLTAGSADFSTFVALGSAVTAGFTDGALFIAGQENSIPNILSQKFALLGGGSFNQPLMRDNIGGLLFGGSPMLDGSFGPRLFFDGEGPAILPATPTTETFNVLSGPFNNMGVPGAKSIYLLYDGYGNPANLATATANPYFVRMASSPSATILGDAMAQNPTFFSLSGIGASDVFNYAISGGDGTDPITPSAGAVGVGFDATYEYLITTLTSGGAKGVVTNVPYINDLPHFTTVPHAPLDPSNPSFGPLIPTLNTLFGALNQVFTILQRPDRYMQFSETAASAVVIKDESLDDLSAQITAVLNANPDFPAFLSQFGVPASAAPAVAYLLGIMYGQARKAKSSDLLVLSSSTIIGTVNTNFSAFLQSKNLSAEVADQFAVEGVTLPLEDKWVLIPSEQVEIKAATDAYNATISSVAVSKGLALVDLNGILQDASTKGVTSGNFTLTSDLVLGGLFGLDGIHPTSRGNALFANEILKALDATYGTNFEASHNLLNVGDYPTNFSPLLQ